MIDNCCKYATLKTNEETKPMKKQNKIKGQARQGDVLIERIAETPESKPDQIGRITLAHGEVTGHSHDLLEGEAWKDAEQVTVVKVNRSTSIQHQEHGPIPCSRGTHRIIRQRQYTPEAIRYVAD